MNEFLVRPRRTLKPRQSKAHLGLISRFRKEEDGVMVAFAVILVIMMIAIGGIGADMMKAEMERTRLQHTLDRAVLAAADLDQERTPTAVVEDYFQKSGVDVDTVTTDSETIPIFEGGPPIYRRVSAVADAQSTFRASETAARFRHAWRGDIEDRELVEKVNIRAAGTAIESIGNVEISLVLDVSGSMNSNSRLSNLKIAAREFIDTMDDNTIDGTLSVSVVPYATQVAVPDNLFGQLTTTGENAYSNCINFRGSDFSNTQISTHSPYQRTMHFDPWYRYDNRDSSPSPVNQMPVCEFDSRREAMVMESDRSTLKNYINNLTARGNTSIDVGMKWGTALVDPTFEPIAANLIKSGDVSSDFADRPYAYGTNDSMKVVVLMTDGQNTSQYYIRDDFRSGESNVWYNEQQDFYSIYVGQDEYDQDYDGNTSEPLYYWPSTSQWKNWAYGEGVYETTESSWECKSYRRNGSCKRYRKVTKTVTVDEPGSAEVITYPNLWAYTTSSWIADYLYRPFMGYDAAYNDWHYGVRSSFQRTEKDARTRQICQAAKDAGVIVFTIGFEAPYSGQTVLKDCASSDSHYFDVDGLEIRNAFATIATSIRQLRLTQ
ncbi:TadE/TadG family type IV pilus assembly protein [Shimia sp. R10_1]|uniref:TadE/TadG family type IV pilus assembly protein n=1 Tax=Shimia sp. R10_1 TaxID=2821095 RepID=UPI001FFE2030|nr:TadE/TadG family type IV pilus assembly protein [Shimia sp. R10_1]